MFSQACVKNSVHRGRGVHPLGRHPQADTTPLLADTLWTPPWADTPPPWTPPRQTPLPLRPLQRTVRILLECILVSLLWFYYLCFSFAWSVNIFQNIPCWDYFTLIGDDNTLLKLSPSDNQSNFHVLRDPVILICVVCPEDDPSSLAQW